MTAIRCEFCGSMFEPAGGDPAGRHPCCGIRPAGDLAGSIRAACRIRGELGRGASGVVYLADQLRLQRPVALKLLHKDLPAESEKLFFSEVRAAGKLQHPNIVRIYSIGETDERLPYAVMEYIAGETIEESVERGVRFPEPEVRRIAEEIADALAYAWETGKLTHGDLKPANVMLRRKDRSVCILDLGLQTARRENGITSAMGTPAYAAPELVNRSFGVSDFRSDVYSLGIMIYELISGKVPFDGTPEEICRMHQKMDAEPLQKAAPQVSGELSELVSAMIARYADSRPDWEEVRRRLPQRETAPAAMPVPQPVRPVKRSRFAAFLRGVLLLVIGAACGFAAARHIPRVPLLELLIQAKTPTNLVFSLAEDGRAAELERILKAGFPVNVTNRLGNTLLMHSVFFNRKDVVQMLLKYRPDLEHRNQQGENVFDLASDYPDILTMLQEYLQEHQDEKSANTLQP